VQDEQWTEEAPVCPECGTTGFRMRADVLQEATANDQDETETTCEHCGASLLVRIGYYVEVVR